MIICDLDGLKIINDSLGHQAGDQLLIRAAQILSAGVREGDVVARVGGDEFVILLPRCSLRDAENVISRIKALIKKYNLNNWQLPLNISIGYASTTQKSKIIDDLYNEADDHMYRVKLKQRPASHSSILKAIKKTLESKDFAEQGNLKRLQNMAEAMGKAVELSSENGD